MSEQNKQEFDYAFALSAMGDDREIYLEVLDAYLQSMPGLLTEVEVAVQSGDREVLRRAVHSIKSSSWAVGGMALGTTAEEIEKQVHQLSDGELVLRASQLRAGFSVLCRSMTIHGLKTS
jgi:HPt (histidine-containing phosphotransfer) domain-containing protein